MTSMSVRAAFAIFLLFAATVEAGKGYVQFWRKNVTLTCPNQGNFQDKVKNVINDTNKYEFMYANDKKGFYYCVYQDEEGSYQHYHFYVQGKVCENCFELDGTFVMVIIVADVVMTVSVMAIIFKCTKKKGSAGPARTSNPPARPGPRGTNPPNSTYQELAPHTRSQDTYSTVNRMG